MKSKTCHRQKKTKSLKAVTLSSSEAVIHNQNNNNTTTYWNNSISGRQTSIEIKASDVNNNENNNNLAMTTSAITVKAKPASKMTEKLPAIISNSPPSSRSTGKYNEKYSLRQRQKRSFAMPSTLSSAAKVNSIVSSDLKAVFDLDEPLVLTAVTKNHRNSLNLTTSQLKASTCGSKEKSKTKAAPLSKYRRKTANARERTRMREINSAFENLRHCVPHTITGDQTASSNEKLTKITTLRLAMKYIRVLTEVLENASFQKDFLLECLNDGDHRFSTPNWIRCSPINVPVASEVNTITQHQPQTVPQARPKARKTKLQPKVYKKRQRMEIKDVLCTSYSNSSSTFSSPLSSSSSSSAYASMSASPLFEDYHSTTDLNGMMLESDGESLHLSEPCLSPMNRNYHMGVPLLSTTTSSHLLKTFPLNMDTETPLELSLRLLEPDVDSLEFSSDQQPSTCTSPLETLEPFNPFGDLMHAEFPEQSSLDLFLT